MTNNERIQTDRLTDGPGDRRSTETQKNNTKAKHKYLGQTETHTNHPKNDKSPSHLKLKPIRFAAEIIHPDL